MLLCGRSIVATLHLRCEADCSGGLAPSLFYLGAYEVYRTLTELLDFQSF